MYRLHLINRLSHVLVFTLSLGGVYAYLAHISGTAFLFQFFDASKFCWGRFVAQRFCYAPLIPCFATAGVKKIFDRLPAHSKHTPNYPFPRFRCLMLHRREPRSWKVRAGFFLSKKKRKITQVSRKITQVGRWSDARHFQIYSLLTFARQCVFHLAPKINTTVQGLR